MTDVSAPIRRPFLLTFFCEFLGLGQALVPEVVVPEGTGVDLS